MKHINCEALSVKRMNRKNIPMQKMKSKRTYLKAGKSLAAEDSASSC